MSCNELPGQKGFPSKYPSYSLIDLSSQIVQPHEFIREYNDTSQNSVAFLRAANVEDGHLNTTDFLYVDVEKIGNHNESFIRAGDILITRTGAKAGATVCVRELSQQYCVSSHTIRIVPKKEKVEPLFIEAFLLSRWGKKQIERLFTGAAQKQLQLKTVGALTIPLPPLTVQRKLAAAVEAARESRKKKLQKADELLGSLDKWIMEKLGLAVVPVDPKTVFAVKRVQIDKVRLDTYFYLPALLNAEQTLRSFKGRIIALSSALQKGPINGVDARNYLEKGQRYLRVQNIRPFEIDPSEIKFVKSENQKEVRLLEGDVLLTRKGTFGVAAQVPHEYTDCLISSEIILLRVSENSPCSPEFIVAWLNSLFAQTLMDRYKAGGIMGHLTQDVVSNFPVPVPSVNVQQGIATEIHRRREEARRLRAEAEKDWQEAKERFETALLGNR